ncbi:TPA: hypothetical protein ACPXNN_002203, partial [Streptococcus pneumoniae]
NDFSSSSVVVRSFFGYSVARFVLQQSSSVPYEVLPCLIFLHSWVVPAFGYLVALDFLEILA